MDLGTARPPHARGEVKWLSEHRLQNGMDACRTAAAASAWAAACSRAPIPSGRASRRKREPIPRSSWPPPMRAAFPWPCRYCSPKQVTHRRGSGLQAKARIERSGNGFAITHIELVTEGDVPGLDARTFSAHAEVAKRSCPVSKALAGVDISLAASLLERSGGIEPRRPAAARAAPQARTPVMSRRGSERFQEAR